MRSLDCIHLPEVLFIIAHDKETQALLDQRQISWGTNMNLREGLFA